MVRLQKSLSSRQALPVRPDFFFKQEIIFTRNLAKLVVNHGTDVNNGMMD